MPAHFIQQMDLTQPQRLHPVTLIQRLLVNVPAILALLIPFLRNPSSEQYFSLSIAILLGLITIPGVVLSYLRFRFWLEDREVVIESGVLQRRHRTIPYERIQNIGIEQSLLPRLFGTAKVKIETAGSAAAEGNIEYVRLGVAHALRDAVRAEQRTGTATGEEESADELFRLSVRDVMRSGLFRFSLVYIAVVFSAVEYLGVQPEEIGDWLTGGHADEVWTAVSASPFLAAVASLLFAISLGWASGIVLDVARYYGFVLEREGDKLHTRSGLIRRNERTIPIRKIQGYIVRSNPFMRLFGWYRLEVQTMGSDVEEQGHYTLLPIARLQEAHRLVHSFDSSIPFPEELHPVSRIHIRRQTVRAFFLIAAVAAGLWFFTWYGPWLLLLTPLAYVWARLQYSSHGYRFLGDAVVVQRGFFGRRRWHYALGRSQVFYRSANLFQRRLGVAHVLLDTAGAHPMSDALVQDLPHSDADLLVDRCSERFLEIQKQRRKDRRRRPLHLASLREGAD